MGTATAGPTRGHQLFEAWLIATYGASSRRPGRPCYSGLRQAHRLIVQHARELWGRTRALRPPKSPLGLYHWLASADDQGCRHTPRRHIRQVIEIITEGQVPRESWNQPGLEVAA